MPTLYLYRVTLAMPAVAVAPEGSAAEMAHWLNAQLGKDTAPPDLGPGLSPTGAGPPTHHICSTGWREDDCRRMLGHLADLGGIERPSTPQWNGWTMGERCAWTNGTLYPAMFTHAFGGVRMTAAGVSGGEEDLLGGMGLKPVMEAAGP